jgi:hypothetical protein
MFSDKNIWFQVPGVPLGLIASPVYVTASVKMIQFSYPNKDTKGEEKGERVGRRETTPIPSAANGCCQLASLVLRIISVAYSHVLEKLVKEV